MEKSKCKRCGRELKSEKAIELGYGICCAKKAGIIKPKKLKIIYEGEDLIKWWN